MKKLISVMLLVVGLTCHADEVMVADRWIWVFEGEAAQKYINPTTINNQGNVARVWVLWNSKDNTLEGPLSFKVLEEYRCDEPMVRSLALIAYADYFAEGMTVINGPLLDKQMVWSEIPAGTSAEKLQEVVCTWYR